MIRFAAGGRDDGMENCNHQHPGGSGRFSGNCLALLRDCFAWLSMAASHWCAIVLHLPPPETSVTTRSALGNKARKSLLTSATRLEGFSSDSPLFPTIRCPMGRIYRSGTH